MGAAEVTSKDGLVTIEDDAKRERFLIRMILCERTSIRLCANLACGWLEVARAD